MGVLIARSVLSGAPGRFGTLTCPLLYLLLSFSNVAHGPPASLCLPLYLYLSHTHTPRALH